MRAALSGLLCAASAVLCAAALPPPLASWRSAACQDLFREKVDRAQKERTTWVEEGHLFLPGSESHRQAPAYQHEASTMRRAITYEDVIVPHGWGVNASQAHSQTDKNAWILHCMPLFVRTPVRANKAGFATCGRKRVLYSPVWKAATGSTRAILAKRKGPCRSFVMMEERTGCKGCTPCTPGLGPCRHDTTEPSDLSKYFKFSFVRGPWERFLAGVHEHGVWSPDMDVNRRDIEGWARKFLQHWPHVKCVHRTQSYLLSGTDLFGNQLQWDFLGRLEDMTGSLRNLSEHLGTNMFSHQPHNNPSGKLTAKVSAEAMRMPVVVCTVCKLYLQDFVCFGYPLPERCCRNQCQDFGFQFERPHLQAAGCP